MKTRHRRYEILCLLSSSGQLSEPQLEKLRVHALDCSACWARIRSATALDANLHIAGLAGKRHRCNGPEGMVDRFTARAIREGIPLPNRSSRPLAHNRLGILASVVAVSILAFIASRVVHSNQKSPSDEASGSGGITNVLDSRNPIGTHRSPQLKQVGRTRTKRRAESRSTVARFALTPVILPQPENFFVSAPRGMRTESFGSKTGLKHIAMAHFAPYMQPFLPLELSPESDSQSLSRKCAHEEAQIRITTNDEPPHPPVFCFDPQLAFVADSTIPKFFKSYRSGAGEIPGLPGFQFSPATSSDSH
jgi:hypothetical protein